MDSEPDRPPELRCADPCPARRPRTRPQRDRARRRHLGRRCPRGPPRRRARRVDRPLRTAAAPSAGRGVRSPRRPRSRQPPSHAGRPGRLLRDVRDRAGLHPALLGVRSRGSPGRVADPRQQAVRHLERALRRPDRRPQDARCWSTSSARPHPKAVAAIEARVLPVAGELTRAQIRQRVRRALARLDAKALERRRKEAAARADVCHQPTGDGMSRLMIDLPLWKAAACVDVVRQYADMARAAGDNRPIGVIRAEVAADLILRPWDHSRPPVTARLDIHAPLASLRPAESRHASARGGGGRRDRHRRGVPRDPRTARHAGCTRRTGGWLRPGGDR